MEKNKTGKYFKYAFGEIILVVIGILIALTLSNWNDHRKERIKEKLVLKEISNSINSDLKFFENTLDYRLGLKKEGLDELMRMIGENEKAVSYDTIMKFYDKSETDISINYDSGPYDAVKNYGLEVISNDSLRKLIIKNYEVLFPALKKFGDKTPDLLNPFIEKLKIKVFKKVTSQNDKNVWFLIDTPKDEEILTNSDFKNILSYQDRKYSNYKSRLNYVRKEMIKLNENIIKELEHLNKK
ncbi:DUF6090 family protein [Lacinutrix iliipiscaria]|uniref:DUF6090 family protein n=2 Tax=Lacinutrix iliipiscaria TaxID=1230532 RepID=A0ABW5WMD3_9FLAO